ncbi:MAG: hypothetical protein ACOCRK_08900 [bacterium]
MNNNNLDLQHTAYDFANALETQRSKWFEACLENIKKLNNNLKIDKRDIDIKNKLDGKINLIIKSFQEVHVLSFINMQRYITEREIGDFTQKLSSLMFGSDLENAISHIKRYTELKSKDIKEQLIVFSEDIAIEVTNCILFSPAIDEIVFDFYAINIVLTALQFKDIETAEQFLQKR